MKSYSMGKPELTEVRQDAELLEGGPVGATKVAKELERLRRASFEAARRRSKVPQPLFWSLFHHRIKKIRESKQLSRVVELILE